MNHRQIGKCLANTSRDPWPIPFFPIVNPTRNEYSFSTVHSMTYPGQYGTHPYGQSPAPSGYPAPPAPYGGGYPPPPSAQGGYPPPPPQGGYPPPSAHGGYPPPPSQGGYPPPPPQGGYPPPHSPANYPPVPPRQGSYAPPNAAAKYAPPPPPTSSPGYRPYSGNEHIRPPSYTGPDPVFRPSDPSVSQANYPQPPHSSHNPASTPGKKTVEKVRS
ncbi:uncharacterized protein BYT42DRAFT_204787 [Radiomyces spectabilis]|uniref:uncharacterized protein n=1 Tax=Radiomyces spectabilis TaxID=64574 RepID=UPI00221E84BD|nr:uncharacterized protein BYT42DRAFT_204787 [Radiomyces spectabilis]KAI8391698.1 hypothetical protein BYT42DRAFT_204787 [Radiomyces spectabilis]